MNSNLNNFERNTPLLVNAGYLDTARATLMAEATAIPQKPAWMTEAEAKQITSRIFSSVVGEKIAVYEIEISNEY